MSKITDYPVASRFDSADVLLKDGTNGTKIILASDAASEFAGMVSAVNHRNVYRGKNLGTSVTSAQKAAIQAGTFDDLFIGDYWVINGVTWVIADMDYFYNYGSPAFTTHHLVIVPNSPLYDAMIYERSASSNANGYVGSKMYTENLNSAKATISAAFGDDMVLSHRELLVSKVIGNTPAITEWHDSTVELMSEIMVYGTNIYANISYGPHVHVESIPHQLALFALNPRAINASRNKYWLRNTVSGDSFATVESTGEPSFTPVSGTTGVRPEFCIG